MPAAWGTPINISAGRSPAGVPATHSKQYARCLSDITQPGLIKLETDYAAYKEKIIDGNRKRPADDALPTASIRECIDPNRLSSMCMVGLIEGVAIGDDATDEALQAWLDAASEREPVDIAERIESALVSIKYQQVHSDVLVA